MKKSILLRYDPQQKYVMHWIEEVSAGNEAALESSNARRESTMNAKKLVAVREFTDKQGQKHKAGDRIEVDPEYGQELIRRGEVKEDPSAEQLPADPPKAQPK